MDEERRGGFLPPEPPGPEPELGRHQHQPYAPPPGHGWQGQPQGPAPPPGWQPPPWSYAPAVREPDNGPAVAGFVLSVVAAGLLLFSAGLSTIISVGCAVAGMIYSRKGKKKVEAGETSKNAGLAQAGFIVSIVSIVLSIIATGFWVLILVLAIVDDGVQSDIDNELDNSETIRASMRISGAAVRTAAHLLG